MIQITLLQERINQHPFLKAFLNANTARVWDTLSVANHLQERYEGIAINSVMNDAYPQANLVQICAALGKVEHLRYIAQHFSVAALKMLRDDTYKAFRWAATNGHIAVIKWCKKFAPSFMLEMLQAENYQAHWHAARQGHIAILKYLEKEAKEHALVMINHNHYQAYWGAALNGQLTVLCYLENNASTIQKIKMLQAKDYAAFWWAAQKGHLEVLFHLEAIAPTHVPQMIKANGYQAYHGAAANGQLLVMHHLEKLASDTNQLYAMLESNEYLAYREAASAGFIRVLVHLETLAPTHIGAMLWAKNYQAYRCAAANGHLAVLQHLESQAPECINEMIQANNYEVYLFAAGLNQSEIAKHLLQYPTALAYAEMHYQQNEDAHVLAFIDQTIHALQAQKEALEREAAHVEFDIADNQMLFYFYVLRHLIRRNDEALLPDINLLLSIPRLRTHVHLAFNGGPENELLRLALHLGNEGAYQALLNVPAIRALANTHHFYQPHMHHTLTLQALAADPESSMRAFTQSEQTIIQRVQAHYHSTLTAQGGIDVVFAQFKNSLFERYQLHPAVVELDRETVLPLPFDWLGLQQLRNERALSISQYHQALRAYYRHPEHTAFRYLSKPNPWLHEYADYINENDEQTERWAAFEAYIPTIAYFWLAASDEKTPGIDGYTLEGRIALFIKEIALIGRAHNWDNERTVIQANGHVVQEEYDDLQGDRPSCYSGVNRRLFQAVQGHPFFKVLTKEVLRQEINSFVYQYFTKLMNQKTPNELYAIKQTVDELIWHAETKNAHINSLNIPFSAIGSFQQALTMKYAKQYSANEELKFITQQQLLERKDNSGNHYPCHFILFYTNAGLGNLLETILIKKEQKQRITDCCFNKSLNALLKSGHALFSQIERQRQVLLCDRRNMSPEDRQMFDKAYGLLPKS